MDRVLVVRGRRSGKKRAVSKIVSVKINRSVKHSFTERSVIQLGLEPRALSLKVKCSTD